MGPLSTADVSVASQTAMDAMTTAPNEVKSLKPSGITGTPGTLGTGADSSFEERKVLGSGIGVEQNGCPLDDDEGNEEGAEVTYEIPEDKVRGFGIDSRDVNTPDKWIARHPELIRLTGKHPFNCEPPLERLVDHGFITPVSLHYVRNHGYVPHSDWDAWRLEVTGLVKNPTVFSMADLLAMPSRALAVTLVCVGNRRKEQNMVKKTRGFNWGAAGVSTSVWRGVRLRDVLLKCGIVPAHRGGTFVCFEGAETLLGKAGSSGTAYGTSISRARAMDPAQDVILAYEQNGQNLAPDHGYPLRVIIPGYIGGRMVKWLRKIEVTAAESTNYYHYFDNRVLPSFVDSERADAEGWWYKPEYICNELSINSAISHPCHNEELLLTPPGGAQGTVGPMTHLLKGYAYSGGGRKVTRVEITLDDGKTWRVTELTHPEKPTEYGKWWCWCFWRLPVPVEDLMGSREVAVRAWDEATNTQPQLLTWNALGMMNNCWFRIKIHPVLSSQGLALRFEHPTVAGATPGGWMDNEASSSGAGGPSKTSVPQPAVGPAVEARAAPEKARDAAPAKEAVGIIARAGTSGLRQIPLSEVAKHDSADSPWIIVDGKVYDCTKFLKDHPGGAESILINAGTDCTEEFDAIHSRKARAMLADFLIGEVAPEGALVGDQVASTLATSSAISSATSLAVVTEVRPTALKLVSKEPLSRDVRRFRFALPTEEHILGLPVGKHMFLSARIDGSLVMRAYTPTSSNDEVGYFELVVKIYFKKEVPQFPDGGLFSQYLENLAIGDTIDVKGPIGHIHYEGKGVFTCDGTRHEAKRIAMMAGGTGITPMYQVIKAILKDPEDFTEMWLIYANRTESDILLREDLESWAKEHSGRFHVWYTIESPPPPGWTFSTGRVNKEMMGAHLPPSGDGSVAFMCGPPGMIKFGCIPNLESLGYTSAQMFTF